jgi:hypothetical protein
LDIFDAEIVEEIGEDALQGAVSAGMVVFREGIDGLGSSQRRTRWYSSQRTFLSGDKLSLLVEAGNI